MKYLYRVTLDYTVWYRGKKYPFYVVAESKEGAKSLIESKLSNEECSVKAVTCLGQQIAGIIFSGDKKN